jgi:hypothetical protein
LTLVGPQPTTIYWAPDLNSPVVRVNTEEMLAGQLHAGTQYEFAPMSDT